MDKIKIYTMLTLLSSFAGYMEWGTESSSFVLFAEAEILVKLVKAPAEVVHPFILFPLAGQILILLSLFIQKRKYFLITGIVFIAILYLMLLFVGIISLNWKIIISVLPFLVFAFLSYRQIRVTH